MTGSFDVDADQLYGHSASVARYADRLSGIGTRLPDSLADQSLGSFAQFLTAGLGGAMAATMDGFAHAASTVDQVSLGLRDVAQRYQRDDEGGASAMGGIDSTLEGLR